MAYIYELKQRKCDAQGCGHYGASRGSRTHNGVDLCIISDSEVELGFSGEVVKVGYPYGSKNKSHIRYVGIKFSENYQRILSGLYQKNYWHCRVFYVKPSVKKGDIIEANSTVGLSQNLGEFYPGITEHVHFEVYSVPAGMDVSNKSFFTYVNPNRFLSFLRGDSE